jgi:hypothetical protein
MTCLLYWLTGFRGEDFKAFFPIGSYVKTMSAEGGHLGWRLGSSDMHNCLIGINRLTKKFHRKKRNLGQKKIYVSLLSHVKQI